MNYNKLEKIRKERKVSTEKLGEVIGISGPGYIKMIKEKTCRVDYLEKISDYFNFPITFFLDLGDENSVNEPYGKYGNNCCKLCEEKDARIRLLEEILEMYRGKKENRVANSA